jgi:hypothetical protein
MNMEIPKGKAKMGGHDPIFRNRFVSPISCRESKGFNEFMDNAGYEEECEINYTKERFLWALAGLQGNQFIAPGNKWTTPDC